MQYISVCALALLWPTYRKSCGLLSNSDTEEVIENESTGAQRRGNQEGGAHR